MFVYEPSEEHDRWLRQWFAIMQHDDELERTFGQGVKTVDDLLHVMQEPATVYLETDETGPWFVSWIVPAGMDAAYFNLWVAKEHRHQYAIERIYQVLKCVFIIFRVALVVTRQDQLANNAVRFGFTHLGVIPEIFDGQAAHVLYFSKSAFQALVNDVESRLNGGH